MDKKFLYDLMDEFEKRDIQELEFENDKGSVHLIKGGPPQQIVQSLPVAAVAAPGQPQGQVQIQAEGQAAAPEPEEGIELIKAPIVGNFYRQPAPDAPYFVSDGQKVTKGQTLCILEAMKLMNELEAEFDCEIVKSLVENGTMVEFDTPLFEVKRL